MKSSTIAATLALAVALPAVALTVDGIVAKVDSSVILRSDVITEMRHIGASPDRFNEIRNEMIDRKLIVKAAEEAKMTIQEWVIDNRVREIVQKAFDGDRNRLMETLANEKVSFPEWRQRLKEDMIVSAMRWQVVDKNVSPSPAELKEEFKNHPERYVTNKKTTVSVILLKPEDSDKRDEVQAALRDQPFAAVARKYSADAHASEGGVWKDVNPDEVFRPEVCEEITAMPKGTLSHWIDLDGWSFLLRKDEEQHSRAMTFAEAYEAVTARVKDDIAERLQREWLDRLRAEAYVKVYE